MVTNNNTSLNAHIPKTSHELETSSFHKVVSENEILTKETSKQSFEKLKSLYQSSRSPEVFDILENLGVKTELNKKQCQTLMQTILNGNVSDIRPVIKAYVQLDGNISSLMKEFAKQYRPDKQNAEEILDKIGMIFQEEQRFMFGKEDGKASSLKKMKYLISTFFNFKTIPDRMEIFFRTAEKTHGLDFRMNSLMPKIMENPLGYLVEIAIINKSKELFEYANEAGWKMKDITDHARNGKILWSEIIEKGVLNGLYEKDTGQKMSNKLEDRIKQYIWISTQIDFPKSFFKQLTVNAFKNPQEWKAALEFLKSDKQVQAWLSEKKMGSLDHLISELEAECKLNHAFYKINGEHFKRNIEGITQLAPLEKEVNLEDLETMFATINFKDPSKKDYINPVNLKDDGKTISVKDAQASLKTLLRNIKENTPINVSPRDPEKRKMWYGNISNYLKHIIVSLKELPEDERAGHLMDIAVISRHCGGRYIGQCLQTYQLLNDQMQDFPQQVLASLNSMRIGIAETLAPKVNKILHVHAVNAAIGKLGKIKGLAGYEVALQDPGIQYIPVHTSDLELSFDKRYTPSAIVEKMVAEINEKSSREMYERALEWFKDNIPLDWNPPDKNYSQIMSELKILEDQKADKEAFRRFLRQNDITGSLSSNEEIVLEKELKAQKDFLEDFKRIDSNLQDVSIEEEDRQLYQEAWDEKLQEYEKLIKTDISSLERESILEDISKRHSEIQQKLNAIKPSSQELATKARNHIENDQKQAYLEEIVDENGNIKKESIINMLKIMNIITKQKEKLIII